MLRMGLIHAPIAQIKSNITLKGMSWNYRVIATQHNGETCLAIHEVYYHEHKPCGLTEQPVYIGGNTIKDLRWTLNRMKEALKKPVLWGGDKFPQEYEQNP